MSSTLPLKPTRLKPGDRVRLLSPASPPISEKVAIGVRLLESWGLKAEVGTHAFDRHRHFLAGKNEDRLADWNDALRDPGVRAVFITRGGKGSYRIAHALDFAVASSDPKTCIGFSDTSILHLCLWHRCHIPGFHGPHMAWDEEYFGRNAADQLRRALMEPQLVTIRQDVNEVTAKVIIPGVAHGILMGGGNLQMIGCPAAIRIH